MAEVQQKKNEIVLVQGQLKKIIHQEGQGDMPQNGQEVYALYRGTLQDGSEFDSNQSRDDPFKFTLGQGQVIKGWDQGFASMKKGQRATLICSPDFAYGARGSPPRIPPNATLHFEVELLDFKDKKKQKWQMSLQEKVTEATKLKDSGNQNLKNGKLTQARNDYKQGITYVDAQQEQPAKNILKILRLNNAQACLQDKDYGQCIQSCTKVLKQDPNNQKALYRRGSAYLNSQDFNLAQVDLENLVKLDQQNAAAKNLLTMISQKKRQFEKKQKKVFATMFSKPLYEDKKPQPPKQQPKDQELSSDEQFKQPQSPEKQQQQQPEQVDKKQNGKNEQKEPEQEQEQEQTESKKDQ